MLRSVSWLVVGRVLGDALALLFYIALARAFGAAGMGDYAFAFAIATFLATGVEFGFAPLITREIARRPSAAAGYAGRIILVQLALAGLAALVLAGLVAGAGYSRQLGLLVGFAFLGTVLQALGNSFAACLEAIEAMSKRATLEIVMKLVATIAGLVLIGLGAHLHVVVVAHALGGLIYLIIGLRWIVRRFGPVVCRPDWTFARSQLAAALPFVGQAALYLLYTRVDVMMLHALAGDVETGRYAAAIRLTTTPFLLPYMVGVAIYPRLSRAGAGEVVQQRALFLAALRWLALLGAAGAVTLGIVGADILVLLFGPSFVEAGPLMPWMAVLFFLGFVRVPYERLLLARNREHTHLSIEAVALVVNVFLNALLIPDWGSRGAVWASIASQLFVLGALHGYGTRLMAARYATQAARLLLAGAGGLVGALALQPLAPWAVLAVVTPLMVLALAALLGLITPEDRRTLHGAGGWWQ